MPSAGLSRALDAAHKAVVGVLVASTAYFTVELCRVTWAIQGSKVDAAQRQREAEQRSAESGGGGAAAQ